MPNCVKKLWALELNIGREAGVPEYWVIHAEEQSDGEYTLCVYETKKAASERAKMCDHEARVVPFVRANSK